MKKYIGMAFEPYFMSFMNRVIIRNNMKYPYFATRH